MEKIRTVPPTQKTIAQACGVSRETVAQILNGRIANRYNGGTREKVLATAKRLGYRPHRAAQTMRRGRSNLIGIVQFGAGYQVIRDVAHYLPQGIVENGYDTFAVDLSWHGGSYRRAMEQLVDLRVEGVIISYQIHSFGTEEVEVLTRAGIPAVALAGGGNLGIPSVLGDISPALVEMVRHLHGLGHRDLLLLVSDDEGRSSRGRIEGFEKGIREFPDIRGEIQRLPSERRIARHEPGIDQVGAYQYVRQLIATKSLPDAILCSNDRWARSVFAALLEAGLRVPEDVAVTGFDNESFAGQAPYYLTTASHDIAGGCRKAVEMLVDLIARRHLDEQSFLFPYKVITRRSSGAAFVAPDSIPAS